MKNLMQIEEVKVVVGGKDGKSVLSVEGGVGFCKSEDKFGIFGNMSGVGLNKLVVNNLEFNCSESLFVCMKFEDNNIIEELRGKSGMSCKLSAKRFSNLVRKDWDDIRIEVMRWVLRVKLFYNIDSFGKVLLESGEGDIFEVSNYYFDRKNNNSKLWGVCKVKDSENRKGYNWLGKLLVELREEFKSNKGKCDIVKGFSGKLGGKDIEDLVREGV
jgi:ribA/ribD-fused uncharacterized protein